MPGRSLEQSELLDCQMSTAVARLSPLISHARMKADQSAEPGMCALSAVTILFRVASHHTSHITHHTSHSMCMITAWMARENTLDLADCPVARTIKRCRYFGFSQKQQLVIGIISVKIVWLDDHKKGYHCCTGWHLSIFLIKLIMFLSLS